MWYYASNCRGDCPPQAHPGVDPTARNGRALQTALNRGHANVVVVLRADPRMAQYAGLVAQAPAAP